MQDFELLERQRELSVLSALISAACQGAGHLAVVEGAAGIGKTRLLAAARAEGAQTGMQVLGARGSELEREFAYGMVRQLFEPVLTGAGGAGRSELLAGAAGQAGVLFDQAETTEAPGASFAMLHGLYWLTANLGTRGPLMLVMDDLHWSDVPSLRFLAYLLPRLEGLPLLVLGGLRPAETAADQHLLTQISTDPLATIIRPAPLSPDATATLVRTVMGGAAETAFCAACHTATGGNPLLLHKLADLAAAEGLEPTAAGAARLYEIGPRVVGQRVMLRLARLGQAATALCNAVAVLGDGAKPAHAAALAGLDTADALQTARQLTDIEIFHRPVPAPDQAWRSGTLRFAHPLVRSTVYEALAETDRLGGHRHAARLLSEAGEAAEQVAAHLLRIPPAAEGFVVATLRQAADEASRRGSPESVVAYLERCLHEPPPGTDRADILLQLGNAARLVDMAKGATYLDAAMAATDNPERKAAIAEKLGIVLYLAGRTDEAAQVLSQATDLLGDIPGGGENELQLRLDEVLLGVGLADPAFYRRAAQSVRRLREAAPSTGVSGRILDLLVALYDTYAGRPGQPVVERARRGLGDGSVIVNSFAQSCYLVLIAADQHDAMALLDAGVAEANRRSSLLVLTPTKWLQGLASLSRGALADAEASLREALWSAQTASHTLGTSAIVAHLAEVLLELGKVDDAEKVLAGVSTSEPMTCPGYWYWYLESKARLLIHQGQVAEGLRTMLAAGRRFEAHGGRNPALVAWRTGAALALSRLDRLDEARVLAAEELALARRWGAPRALGRALWVSGLLHGDGLPLLREAVDVLAPSPARLEHAKALLALGSALRRCGERTQARQHLRHGTEIAQICGASPLVESGLTELRATGARPRRITPSGLDALTPRERRVAEFAAAGLSNREIAQALFITTNTVEVHLTRTYRKLGVGRTDLKKVLLDSE